MESWGVDTQLPDFGTPEQPAGNNLPPELQGVDLQPDDLEKINGDDNTDKKRIIISYYPKEESEVAALIGLEKIEKITYDFDEIKAK